MSAADPTIKARTDRLRARDKARGFVAVKVRVPAERAEELREIARRWRSSEMTKGDA